MKKMKRVLSVTLATALFASAVASSVAFKPLATKSTTTNYSKAKALTLTVFSQTANYTGTQTGWYAKVLKSKFNVTLKIISGQGEGANQFTTRSAAGNLGDLVILGNTQDYANSIRAKLLTDMSSMLKKGKEGAYIAAKYPKAITRMKKDYGKNKYVYGLPNGVSTEKATTSSEGTDLTYGNYMLYSAYKKAGSPKIKTLEDVLTVATKMKKARPIADNGKTTYGFSLFKDWDGSMMCCAKQYCCVYGYDEWGFALVNAKGDVYDSILDQKGQYYRNLKFYHNASKMGLLDPDSYAQTQSDYSTKLDNGQILTCWWNWACQPQYNSVTRTSNSYKNTTTGVTGADGYVLVPINNEKIYSNGYAPAGVNYSLSIGSKCQDKKRCMALINWMYSPEGVEVANDGPKGLLWTTDKKGKNPTLTTLGKKCMNNNLTKMPSSWGGGTYQDGMDKMADFKCVAENGTDPNTGDAYVWSKWKSYTSKPTDLQKTWTKTIGGGAANSFAYLLKHKQIAVAPGTTISKPTLSTINLTKENNVKAIIRKYSWQMAMTKSDSDFGSLWTKMINEAKSSGFDDVNNVYKAQWKKLKAARAAA